MYELKKYQSVIANYICSNERAIVLLSMGLGKTIAAIAASSYLLHTKKIDRVVVIGTKMIAENVWHAEIAKYLSLFDNRYACNMDVSVCTGTPQKRKEKRNRACSIYVFPIEHISEAVEVMTDRTMLILDELTKYKTHNSKSTIYANILSRKAIRCVGLTGTIISNGLQDMWCQVATVQGSDVISDKTAPSYMKQRQTIYCDVAPFGCKTIHEWHDMYCVDKNANMMRSYELWVVQGDRRSAVLNELPKYSLAVPNDIYTDLPDKNIEVVSVVLSPAERKMYDKFIGEESIDVTDGDANQMTQEDFCKAQQVCNDFHYSSKDLAYYGGKHRTKLNAVIDLAIRVREECGQVIIFSWYRDETEYISNKLIEKGISLSMKDGLAEWLNHETDVLLAHPASFGHGLNLHTGGCHNMIWSSIPWAPELYMQACGRLVRLGQDKPVNIYIVETIDTVESIKRRKIYRMEGLNKDILSKR